MKIAILSLGCPKNQVDADRFARALIEAGHDTVADASKAEVLIINTCGFIQSAQEEAIEAILDGCALKKENPQLKIVVTGCLAERFRDAVAAEFPEIDAVVGIGSNMKLPQIVAALLQEQPDGPVQHYGCKTDLPLDGSRVISTPGHYAWLKIAEGCSNACSYCAIPAIRGPLRSRQPEQVLDEARWLAQQGVREIVLVAQDVTAYGMDKGERWLVPLLKELERIEGLVWIRMLYTYPEHISKELVECVAASKKILPYFDIPVQHCNNEILQSMRRKSGAQAIRAAIKTIRDRIPAAVLRTSIIAGYPGETKEQFDELCAFVQDVKFDRLGCFAYSPEEGTAAARLPGQLDEEERQHRADVVMRLQAEIMDEKQRAFVGKEMLVVCDGFDSEERYWLCRGYADAPEIDVNVLLPEQYPMTEGAFYWVDVCGMDGCDLVARNPKLHQR